MLWMIDVFKINWERIKNGSNVGSKVSNQRRRPVFDASNVLEGKNSRKQNKMRKRGVDFFKTDP